ncbi:hypothetical protein VTP01DRAFT_4966 [Rhizomucor pusillus]|uniref:uncharacterized protein n=1 Tax=Rhizomucor pusillus TaxID=4840 RepID=UPI0037431641
MSSTLASKYAPKPANVTPPSAPQSPSSPTSPSAPLTGSLYVGELDTSVTEAMLFEIFNRIGPVASIRVCRDVITRRSLGYAYVNFTSASDAERAIKELNYSLIQGRPCRIMFSQRDPTLRKTGAGNIFIKNLDPSIDNKGLHGVFEQFGKVLSCKISLDEQGRSMGYGFVQFDSSEAANRAIENINGMLLNGRKAYVTHHIPKKERQVQIEEQRSHFTNVYVKNLPLDVNDDELRTMFGKYGPITSATVAKDEDNLPKGFGFVNFQNHEDARRAVEEMHDTDYFGKKLYVSRAQKKTEREQELRKQYEEARIEKLNKYQGVNLFIKNLDDDIDDERLRQEFSPFGIITSAKVMRDETTNISRGFGFVCFTEADEATRAIAEMNGRMIGSKPIYVGLAQRKDVRRSQLEAQIAQRNMQMQHQQHPTPNAFAPAQMFYNGSAGAMAPTQPPQMFAQSSVMAPRPRWQPPQPSSPSPPQQQSPVTSNSSYVHIQRPSPPQQRVPPASGNGSYVHVQHPPQQPTINTNVYIQRPPIATTNSSPVQVQRPSLPQQPPEMTPPTPAAQPSQQPAQSPAPAKDRLTVDYLSTLSPQMQKQTLGERLYPLIYRRQKQYAGKITGMLLEMEIPELVSMLENEKDLEYAIQGAMEVLQRHFNVNV